MSHTRAYSAISTPELQKLLEASVDSIIKFKILSEIKQREESSAVVEAITIATQLHLPFTDNEHSPLPNLFLRSNLFSASKTHGKKDTPIRDFKITTYQPGKEELLVTAYRSFNQSDLDVLLVLIQLQQEQQSHFIKITAYELAMKITGFHGKNQYEAIKEQIKLFRNANIELKFNNYEFVGGILNNAFFDNEQQHYVIEFNPKLQPLFSKNSWTALDIKIREKLSSNLAKWLHGFYSSHLNSNIPIKTETIYNLCGATDSSMRRWNSVRLVDALENLKDVYAGLNLKFEFELNNGLLKIKKSQSKSQNKSIKFKMTKRNKINKKVAIFNTESRARLA